MALQLRTATVDDAGPLAALAEATFRATFADTNSAQDMDQYCASSFGTALQLQEIKDPDLVTMVADQGGELVAFGQLRRGSAPACVRAVRPAEIRRLYLDRAWHGQGLAQQLMAALMTRAESWQADAVWLGVWEHNPRAVAFYEKSGFRVVGDHEFVLGTDRQRDLVMMHQGQRLAP